MHFTGRSMALLFGVSALAALAFVPGTAGGQSDSYSVRLLENPDDAPWVWANDANDSGRIVGGQELYRSGIGWTDEALLWKKWNADPVLLDPLPEGIVTEATGINDAGQVCGYSSDGWNFWRAVIWEKDGTVTDMHPDLGWYYSQFSDINQYGDATGIVFGPSYARAFRSVAGEDPELLELDESTYVQSWPYAVNKDRVVVGFARAGSISGYIHACFWDREGVFEDLHDEIEDDLGVSVAGSRAVAVSDNGAIGGVAAVTVDASGQPTDLRPFIWTETDGFHWLDSGGSDLAAVGGSAGKHFVGIIDGSLQSWSTATAAIWTRRNAKGATYWDLDLLPLPEGHAGMVASGVTTSGRIVGTSVDADGYWFAWYADK